VLASRIEGTLVIVVKQLVNFLRSLAPVELAESWDNVGLLIGDPAAEVSAALTCLTLTPDVAAEAIDRQCQLIVTHHPVLFRPTQRLTAETHEGRMLLALIRAGISVYSPHTGYDSAADGINAQLARLLNLRDVQPLRVAATVSPDPNVTDVALSPLGSGRGGSLDAVLPLRDLIARVKLALRVTTLQFVGDLDRPIHKLGIACGAAAEFLHDAARIGCDALLTGEARFHACLEARAENIALILPGHYATERPAMEYLATVLQSQFPTLSVQASQRESDPLCFA
jgi:dinuclear metal center YbgI/SA1388 family protein